MSLRIAVFGQAPFGRDVATRLAEAGHEIVGVHVPPDGGGRADPLALEAEERGWPLFRYKGYRRKGQAIQERVDEYLALGAELNVLPFTTVILPPEIIDAPKHKSVCFHPSLLPAFRGGSALAWQIIEGVLESGVSVFQPDDGVDTGPLYLQKGNVPVSPIDNTASLYFDKL
jgi:methionyl-tRNA formyltransferase